MGGVGFSSILPGTLGSLVGLGFSFILRGSFFYQAAACGAVILLGLWSCGPTARAMQEKDPGCIIVDEVAGMMLAPVGLPASWPLDFTAFLLFRFLDIVKPPPIHQLQKFPGSLGIMLDDLVAGLCANLLLRLIIKIL